ncbi:aspartyl protease family protein [Novosphingobium sp. ZN18A2]|uniref:aspartyl protease family protein n=1 Tax=Novosphingobium sp. ZN18A2 TaxID=3079861 RepID=UPI0030CC8FA3
MIRTIFTIVAACTPLSAHAENLVVRGDRLFIPVNVKGERIEALLDSGAELTVFDRKFAERTQIQGQSEVEARGTGASTTTATLSKNVQVSALGRQIQIPVAAIMDLSDVGTRLVHGPLPMVLGREVFDAGKLSIDIRNARIEWLPESAQIYGRRLALKPANGIETITVRFGPSTEVNADFDLGNGTGLLISADLAKQLKLAPVGVEPGGGIGGAADRLVVFVPQLAIAGKTFYNVRAHVSGNMQEPANIGVSILRHFRIVTDFPNGQVWFEAQGPD